MLHEQPSWTFQTPFQLTQWYGNVQLTSEGVIGQWFAVDRHSGHRLWERKFWRPNTVFDVTAGVILAAETRSDGPWTAGFGCYAIDAGTGALLWEWHGAGLWGKVVKALDWIPGFTNELRPSFVGAKGRECLISSGWVLDVATGRRLRKETDAAPWKLPPYPRTPPEQLYAHGAVEIAPQHTLWWKQPPGKVAPENGGGSKVGRPFMLRLDNASGSTLWRWGPSVIDLHLETNFYGWRWKGDRLYFICGEEPAYKPDPKRKDQPFYVVTNPTRYHLVVLDVATGNLLQRIPIGDRKLQRCRIEDVDSDGILISLDGKELRYYANQTPA